jgi:hypothetical protein
MARTPTRTPGESPAHQPPSQPEAPNGPQDAEAAPETTTIGRTPNGRYAPGFTGNPNGRPPKPKPNPLELLEGFLEEEAPPLPGLPSGSSYWDVILRCLCGHAAKNPRIALEILKLVGAGVASRLTNEEQLAASAANEDGILDEYLAQERRRARLREQREEPESDSDLPDENDESEDDTGQEGGP